MTMDGFGGVSCLYPWVVGGTAPRCFFVLFRGTLGVVLIFVGHGDNRFVLKE